MTTAAELKLDIDVNHGDTEKKECRLMKYFFTGMKGTLTFLLQVLLASASQKQVWAWLNGDGPQRIQCSLE